MANELDIYEQMISICDFLDEEIQFLRHHRNHTVDKMREMTHRIDYLIHKSRLFHVIIEEINKNVTENTPQN